MLSLPVLHYSPQEDEVSEADLPLLDGEEPGELESLPVRLLTGFTVYNASAGCRLVPFDALLVMGKNHTFSASGLAQPWKEPDSDDSGSSLDGTDEESQPQLLELLRILEVSVHWVEDSPTLALDK